MTRIVVPFRGSGAKGRLAPLGEWERTALALAMLGDVVAACRVVAPTTVVTDDPAAASVATGLGATTVTDPGAGQGAAVAAALAADDAAPVLVVNADVPCVTPFDLRALRRGTPPGGIAYVQAHDGTTNALGLADGGLFAPVYGTGSAARFHRHAESVGATPLAVAIPNLADDVDTIDDLRRVGLRAGPRTQAAISSLGIAA